MIPVQQTRVGAGGNCMAAAISSILEIPLWEVPEFSHDDDQFLMDVQEFLASRGLYYVQVPPDEPTVKAAFRQSLGPAYHTIEGTSPRGGQHAVVGDRGLMIFDPHPQDGTGRGMVSVQCYGLLCKRF
jgi:hypothetical protein